MTVPGLGYVLNMESKHMATASINRTSFAKIATETGGTVLHIKPFSKYPSKTEDGKP